MRLRAGRGAEGEYLQDPRQNCRWTKDSHLGLVCRASRAESGWLTRYMQRLRVLKHLLRREMKNTLEQERATIGRAQKQVGGHGAPPLEEKRNQVKWMNSWARKQSVDEDVQNTLFTQKISWPVDLSPGLILQSKNFYHDRNYSNSKYLCSYLTSEILFQLRYNSMSVASSHALVAIGKYGKAAVTDKRYQTVSVECECIKQ